MKELITFIKRFAAPYKWNIVVSVFFNLLTAFFTLFSFAFIIPILQMLFGINAKQYFYMAVGDASIKDVVINNFYYYVGEMIAKEGPSLTLLLLGMLLTVATLLKVLSAYASECATLPLQNGVVRDIATRCMPRSSPSPSDSSPTRARVTSSPACRAT